MASQNNGSRKRKSAGLENIFEVSDKDLSPEREELDSEEPKSKILKSCDSDVSESKKNNEEPNLKHDKETTNLSEISDNFVENTQNTPESLENKSFSEDTLILLDSCISEMEDVPVPIVDNVPKAKTPKWKRKGNDKSVKKKKLSTAKPKVKKRIKVSSSNKDKKEKVNDNRISLKSKVQKKDDVIPDVFLVVESTDDDYIGCDINTEPNKHDELLEEGEITEPLITIKFSDISEAEIYKPKFLEFIRTFAELKALTVGDTIINIFRDDACVLPIKEVERSVSQNRKNQRKRKKSHKQQPEFFVDIKPCSGDEKLTPIKIGESKKLGDEKKEEKKISFGPKCFNCEGAHPIKDCSRPRDFAKINENKQKLQQNKNKSSRYHLEEDQKYGHIQPGKISSYLRNALGLRKNEIPSYIYRMRMLGYPPGWLEAAKITSSELAMYDRDGNAIKNVNAKKATGLDPEKIIEYPGFNVSLEKGFKDEFRLYGVPKYSDSEFSKQIMIENYTKFVQSQIDDFETKDMDIEDEKLDETQDTQQNETEESIDSDFKDESLSLQELENQKNSILEEIKKAQEIIPWDNSSNDTSQLGSDENTPENVTNDIEQTPNIEKKNSEELPGKIEEDSSSNKEENSEKIEDEDNENSDVKTENDEKSINKEYSLDETGVFEISTTGSEIMESNSSFGSFKQSIIGTPILKSNSPYIELPKPDYFMEGVSPVIDFENLPNSTGKYEQMTGVLQKVRKKIKSLHLKL